MQPLVAGQSGCAAPTLAAIRNSTACPARTLVRRVGQPFRGQAFSRDSQARCSPRHSSPDQLLYQLGPDVPPTDFAELRTVEM
jgi:hypothetical protein